MAIKASFEQRVQLAQETRKRFVTEAERALMELAAAMQERLTALMSEAAPSREMQSRRDAWTAFQRHRAAWVDGTLKDWRAALAPPVRAVQKAQEGDLELVGTDVVENKILASRLVLGVAEKVSAELNDLQVRIKFLQGLEDLEGHDILRPEVLVLLMVEQWANAGLPREAWPMVSDLVLKLLSERLLQAYANANALLIKQGVLPVIELTNRVKRVASAAAPRAGPSSAPAPGLASMERQTGNDSGQANLAANTGAQGGPGGGPSAQGPTSQGGPVKPPAGGAFGGRLGWGHDTGSAGRHRSGYGSAADETRMMTSNTPLARARSRAQGVLGQLKRLLIGSGGSGFEATHYQPPSPALAAAIAVRSRSDGHYSGAGT
ncbi:MAG: DUF1631 family protein, partial [Rhodoferax sp.]